MFETLKSPTWSNHHYLLYHPVTLCKDLLIPLAVHICGRNIKDWFIKKRIADQKQGYLYWDTVNCLQQQRKCFHPDRAPEHSPYDTSASSKSFGQSYSLLKTREELQRAGTQHGGVKSHESVLRWLDQDKGSSQSRPNWYTLYFGTFL